MKGVIGIALAFALMLSIVPGIAAADDTFHAFSTLSAAEQATLTLLTDDQLTAIKGAEGLLVQIDPLRSSLLESVYAYLTGSTIQAYYRQMQEDNGRAVQTNLVEMSQQQRTF